MATLSAETLFERYLWPLYPDDARADLARARGADANPAGNPALVAHLADAARVFVAMAPGLFAGDDPRLDGTDASVHRLSVALTPARRDVWAARGAAGTADSELFNVIVHASAYVGECIRTQHGGRWGVRRPLWESVVRLESRAGVADLAVLQWLVKSLADPSGDLPEPTLADRYRTHVELPCHDPETTPVFIQPGDRRIPRLAKVRYASLHQHLRAHVPELRDLGADFPSPERFEAMRLSSVDALVVGGGRMLLLFGPGDGGAYLFWLSAAGFDKSVHLPADPFPAPVVRLEGDKLRVLTQVEGKPATHEMLWWGP
jgi:hypothetical protein